MKTQLVDSKNKYLYVAPDGRYALSIDLSRFTGAVTTGAVFALRNQVAASNNKLLSVHKLIAHTCFTGTTAATVQNYQFKRFSTATHSGGSSILSNIVKNHTTMPTSIVLDARVATISGTSPLTDTSVVYETPFRQILQPRNVAGTTATIWTAEPTDDWVFHPGEGFCIFIPNTAVVGDGLTLDIEWDEYDHDLIGASL